jgi:hypothetical protein
MIAFAVLAVWVSGHEHEATAELTPAEQSVKQVKETVADAAAVRAGKYVRDDNVSGKGEAVKGKEVIANFLQTKQAKIEAIKQGEKDLAQVQKRKRLGENQKSEAFTGASDKTSMWWSRRRRSLSGYRTIKRPRETVGPHLSGSGGASWTSLTGCINRAKAYGHRPGTTLRYVQKAGNRCYFYGPGPGSGRAGSENWRLDLLNMFPFSPEQSRAWSSWRHISVSATSVMSDCSKCPTSILRATRGERSFRTGWEDHFHTHAYKLGDEEKKCGCVGCPPGEKLHVILIQRRFSGSSGDFFMCQKNSYEQGVKISPHRLSDTALAECAGTNLGPILAIKRNKSTITDLYTSGHRTAQRWTISCRLWKSAFCFTIPRTQVRKCVVKKTLEFVSARENRQIHRQVSTLESAMAYDELKKLHVEAGLCHLPALVA